MKRGKSIGIGFLGIMAFLIIFVQPAQPAAATNSFEQNYTLPKVSQQTPIFEVLSFKYEPYPVDAGEWFDIWVKAENVGQSDAKDAVFTLVAKYPFEADNSSLTREFGIVPGVVTAHQYKQSGDFSIQINEVIMKFRVKVADNAPDGQNMLDIRATTDNNPATGFTYSLPVEIRKTKTKFDVTLQDISSDGIAFVVKNIGDNPAGAVDLTVPGQDGIGFLSGNKPSDLGDLKEGDFVITHQSVIPKDGAKDINVQISYTDLAGIRNTVDKTIPLSELVLTAPPVQESSKPYLKWIYGVVGLLVGAMIVILVGMTRHKNRPRK